MTLAELRTPNLPLQSLGGYSRTETTRLLERAAKTLEAKSSSLQAKISSLEAALDAAHERLAEQASHEPSSVEEAVGEVLVTAHRAAEVVRTEAKDEAEALIAAARAQAQEIVAEAQRQSEQLRATKAKVEEELVQAREDARRIRADAERDVEALRAEARRVRQVIDEFRDNWRNLISDALGQLELRFPSQNDPADGGEILANDLRRRLPTPGAEAASAPDRAIESAPAATRSTPPELGLS